MRFIAFCLVAGLLACSPPVTNQPCSPSNCSGCCDDKGTCQGGGASNACGIGGFACSACAGDEMCSLGRCTPVTVSGGGAGGGTGGGSGGGSGGGTGGGMGGGGGAQDGGMDAGTVDAGVDAGVIDPCAGTLTSCSGRCVDTQADPENCSSCGNVCGSGQVCNRGRCEVLPNDCTVAGASCGPGYYCDPVSKRCMTGCRLTGDCPMGATCANNTCSCPTDQHACGQQCVSSTSTDSCGTSCSACVIPANSAPVCMNAACDFTCNTGFTRQGNDCIDVDECATNNGGCSTNATCANTAGSRTCTCATGFSGDGVTCNDINECQTNNGGCATNATCTNTPGARTCACNTGFMGDGMTCADVDECATNNGGCAAVPAGGVCTNTVGSRTCACAAGFTGNGLTCADVNECATNNGGCAVVAAGGVCTNTAGSRTCSCASGFMGDGMSCTDVNECLTNNGGCAAVGGACTNTVGSRTCACMSGFTGNGVTCTDINECNTNNGGCASPTAGGVCTNMPGTRTCSCAMGYTGDGFSCTDVNECLSNNGGCAAAPAGVCTNTTGSRTCACASGYTGNGVTCTDINECMTNNGGCAAPTSGGVCTNMPGTRTCSCATGFTGNGFTCTDINECSTNNGGCAAPTAGGVCTNTSGSRTCSCATGYTGDGFTCADVNECLTGNGGCSANATCANTTGGRTCTCNAGFSGNGITCIPSGDTCAAPVALMASTTVNNSTASAINDYAGPLSAACGGDSVPGRDVVYSFTPAATGTFNVETVGSGFQPRVYVTSACGTASTCSASDPRSSSVDNFNFRGTAGVPSFITVDSSSTTAAGSFSLQVTPVTAPANDTCATATPLSLGVAASGTFVGAVNDVRPISSCGNGRGTGDVVYSFTPSASGSYTFRETTGADVVMWLSTACDGSCLGIIDEPENFVFALNAGTTYFFILQPYTNATTFSVVVNASLPPTNDTCASAAVLNASSATNGSTTAGVNDYAGPLSAACGNASVPGRDVVYSFTPGVTGNFNVTTTSMDFSPSVYVTTTCGVTTSCTSTNATNASSVGSFNFRGTAGTPVFVTVDGLQATEAGDFTITVAPTTTPPNDTCATATAMTVNTPVSGSFVGAVNDVRTVSGCGTNRGTGDVMFSFTPATSGTYAFTETSNSDVVMWVGTACDGTCLAIVDEPEQLALSLTAGTTYFFILQPYTNATTFTAQVTNVTPPSNETCSAPIALSLSTLVNGSTLGAANDYAGPLSAICGNLSVPGREVVYSYTPSSSGNFNLDVNGTTFAPRAYVTTTCGSGASCVATEGPSSQPSFNFRGTAGTPVLVTVDSVGAASAGDFTLNLTSIAAPANDTCAAAQALTLGVPRSGTTVGAVVDVRTSGGTCGSSRATGEVVYSFTPSATGSYVFRETSGADVVMWISGTTCTGTCLGLIDEPEQLTVSLTAGTTYFFMVEPYTSAGAITVSVDTN